MSQHTIFSKDKATRAVGNKSMVKQILDDINIIWYIKPW